MPDDFYKEQYEELKDDAERRSERESSDRKARERQRKEDYEESLNYADTWEEAFSKGAIKLRREVQAEARDNVEFAGEPDFKPDTWFADSLKLVGEAEKIYREEMNAIKETLEKIRRAALSRAASRVAEIAGDDHAPLAHAIRNDNPNYLVDF